MKEVIILGSTGSIGIQSLNVIKRQEGRFKVKGLSCHNNVTALKKQIKQFSPKLVSVGKEEDAKEIKREFPDVEVFFGKQGLIELASYPDYDILLNSLLGLSGLEPTIAAIDNDKTIALANKETLVAGGRLLMNKKPKILPVDSEHSAIFQAISANKKSEINRLILTASGGPFRDLQKEKIKKKTLKDALKHPNWQMGKKITIDSATMMNKGLEIIEARWLFDIEPEKIDVVIHNESIIHSMVEYIDSSIIAQMGLPDMRLPISYALNYPDRINISLPRLDFSQISMLTFKEPDENIFPCLALAKQALKSGNGAEVALNAANEVLVSLFLKEKIGFYDISDIIAKILASHRPVYNLTIEDILEIDKDAREKALNWA